MQEFSFITASTLISTAKAEAIGATSSSIEAFQDTMMLAKVQQINAKFVNAAHTKHPLGGWSWMRKVYNFQTKTNTSLNGAIASGAASFILTSGADFDDTGRSVIETAKGALDFVDHESKATHTLTVSTTTGAETVSMAHATGEKVEKLYPLPSDYSKARVLYVNTTVYPYERLDQFPSGFTTYGSYILMPRGIGAQDCTLYYEKKGNTISLLTSETNIPSELSQYAIEELKAYIYLVRRKRNDVQTALALAEDGLQYALSMDAQQQSNSEYTRIPLPY